MRLFRLLFAPELDRSLAEALRSAAVLRTLIETVGRPKPSPAGTEAGDGGRTGSAAPANRRVAATGRTRGSLSGLRPEGLLWFVFLLSLAGLGLTAIPPARSGLGAVHRARPFRRHRQRDPRGSRFPGRAGRAWPLGRGRHAVRLQRGRARARRVPAHLARRRRHRGYRARRPLRLRRLGDRAHRRGRGAHGAAAGRAQRGAARGGGPRPSRRRFRQRRLEAVLRGGAGREPPHRAAPARSTLARSDLADP